MPSSVYSFVSFSARLRIRAFHASTLMPVSLPRTKRTNFPSQFRRFSPSLSVSLSRANISPSAASSSDRIEESSETAAISAEIESQNGENDCECFPPYRRGRGRVLKRDRDEAEYRSGRKRRVIKKREKGEARGRKRKRERSRGEHGIDMHFRAN